MPQHLVYRTPPRTPQRYHPYQGALNRIALRAGARLVGTAFRRWASRAVANREARVAQYDRRPSIATSRGNMSALEDSQYGRPTGGVPIHHSTSGGRFARGRGVPRTKTSQYAAQGFCEDLTIGGRIQDPDCVYVGHSSWACDRTFVVVCMALVRTMLKHVNVDVETATSVLPFITGVDTITISWIDSSNTVASQAFPYSPGAGDTVDTLGVTLYSFFRSAIYSNAKRFYQRLVMHSGDVVRVMLNLATAKIDVCNTSYLKVQNSTQSAESGGGGNDSEDIAAVPLQGFSYFGRGNFTGIKEYEIRSKTLTVVPTVPLELNTDSQNGLITLRAANTTGRADAGPLYGNPPNASEMKNTSSSAYTTLEPGVIKTDKLEDQHRMSFNQFLYKNYIAGYVSVDDTGNFGQYSRSMMGHFKVFALEKKLYSNNQDQVQVRYEHNQFIRARVYLRRESHSLQRNLTKQLLDFIPS